MPGERILLTGTIAEGRALGADSRGALPDGRRVISAHQGPRAFEGLRVESWEATPAALEHRDADKIVETLRRIQSRGV